MTLTEPAATWSIQGIDGLQVVPVTLDQPAPPGAGTPIGLG